MIITSFKYLLLITYFNLTPTLVSSFEFHLIFVRYLSFYNNKKNFQHILLLVLKLLLLKTYY